MTILDEEDEAAGGPADAAGGAGARPTTGYDELRDDAGRVRPHWSYLADAFEALGERELAERSAQAQRLLHQDGATYTTHRADGLRRPWALDPVPLVVSSADWGSIERGLIQRAELLDLVLQDLYGERRLVGRGLIPPEVVLGHDGYLRAAHGVGGSASEATTRHLVFAAADLARVPDGSMVVLGDRTQAPSGAGYALENRRVMNRVFPSLFRDAHVHRLSRWFLAVRTALQALVPADGGGGRIVVLTPGAGSETYFEHAFLAAHLGYPLVEGADLTVRGGRVWLRSLGGLEPVDVIVRRVDDVWCDPLELRADSWLGVAGLVDAARRGTVAIANPLGSGVVENPGLFPYLPALCRELLGQELLLASVPTWWLGDAEARAIALDRLPELVLKPISRSWETVPVFGDRLDADELHTWRQILQHEPWRWVAQERLAVSHAPSLTPEGLAPRPAVLRAHLVVERDSYTVLPGGLTRVAHRPDDPIVSNRSGGSSKDTWVLASEPERHVSLWVTSGPEDLGERAVPSRTSENLFWLGRYAERAEATIRLARVVLERLDDAEARVDRSERARLATILTALTHLTGTYPGFVLGDAEAVDHPEPGLLAVLTDPSDAGTLDSTLRSLLSAAYAVRDRLSNDTWQVVSDVEDDLAALRRLGDNLLAVRVVIDRLLRALLALAGLSTESMVRDAGWLFLDTGRRIERGILVTSLARSLLVPVLDGAPRLVEPLVLESFLASAESLVAYRRRFRSHLAAPSALDLVLADPANPRSLRYQLDRLQEDVAALPHTTHGVRTEREERLLLDASTRLRLADPIALARRSRSTGRREDLDELVVRVADLLAATSDAMAARLFTHLQPSPRVLGGPMGDDG